MNDKKAKDLLKRALFSVENDYALFLDLHRHQIMPEGSDEAKEIDRVINETRQLIKEINEYINT